MNKIFVKGMWLFFALTLLSAPVCAEDEGPVAVNLTIFKVDRTSTGGEILIKGAPVRPGDLLQYELTYKVIGKEKILELLALLPVPEGMEYQSGSAKPEKFLVSIDGQDFTPPPLYRQVKNAGHEAAQEEIPATEYRYLGWPLRGISAGEEVRVSARLKVNFVPGGLDRK